MSPILRSAFLLIALGLLVFAFSNIGAHAEEAPAADSFYQYKDDNGVLSFAGSLEGIPSAYRDRAVLRSFESVRESTRPKLTVVKASDIQVHIPAARPFSQVASEPLIAPKHRDEEECDQPLTITSERRQQGRYNREVFIVTDKCGKVLSVTPQTPWVDVSVAD